MAKVKVFLDLGGLLGLQGRSSSALRPRLLRSGLDWSEAMSINDTLETLAGQAGYRTRLEIAGNQSSVPERTFIFIQNVFRALELVEDPPPDAARLHR